MELSHILHPPTHVVVHPPGGTPSTIGDLLHPMPSVAAHTRTPWAILLVAFLDDPGPDELPSLDLYKQLFTSAGAGTMNMVDYFRDMSHRTVDLSDSEVFGWFKLPILRRQWVGNVPDPPPGHVNRDGILELSKNVAKSAGAPVDNFSGVCVSGFGDLDLCGWTGGMAMLCSQLNLEPSLIGQEMGHGYGLNHARVEGSTTDYQDPWDVMSTPVWTDHEAEHPVYKHIGPGINAWEMRSRGWLHEPRVWKGDPHRPFDNTVQLRPLHDLDAPGFLAAELGQYLVELRVPDRWDAGIDHACILAHRFQDNYSYLQVGLGGRPDLLAGDRFVSGMPDAHAAAYEQLDVLSIDPAQRLATVRLRHRPAAGDQLISDFHPPHLMHTLAATGADVGGFIALPGGKVVQVPPSGPGRDLVDQVARYLSIDVGRDVASARAARRSAVEELIGTAALLHQEAAAISDTPLAVRRGEM